MSAALPSPMKKYRLGPNDRVAIRGVDYVWLATTDQGHVLRRADSELSESFTHEEFERLREEPGFRFDAQWYTPGRAKARLHGGAERLADLPAREQREILWRLDICQRFLRKEAAGEATRSDVSMTAAIKAINADILEAAQTGPEGRKVRASKDGASTPHIPGPRQLRRWLREFERGGFEPLALRPRYRNCGNWGSNLDPEILACIGKHAAKYAAENRPPQAKLYEDLRGEIEDINKARAEERLEPFPYPSRKTFAKAVHKLDAFDVCAGREGPDAAKRRFAIVSQGLDVTRPLERVEMDEWRIHLHTLPMVRELWDQLAEDVQKAIKAEGRLWLSVAADCATDVILAARLSRTASVDAAVQTLEMVVSDKAVFAAAVSASSPFDMAGTPECIATDMGSAYISETFRGRVAALGSEHLLPPGGCPGLRGFIERGHRTRDTRLVSRFTGRAFENVVALGDYKPEQRASLLAEEFGWAVLRWIIDVHHNSPSGRLGGETPLNAWRRLVGRYGVLPPPDREKKRAIFGLELRRVLGSRGIRVLGLYFQSETLQQHRRKHGDIELEVRVDRYDLGRISVRIGEGWLTVGCVQPGFDDVAVETWLAAAADLRRRFKAEAELSAGVVHEAIRAIESMARAAERRANIFSTLLSSEVVEQAERELTFGLRLPPAPTTDEPAPSVDMMAGAIPVIGGRRKAAPSPVRPADAAAEPVAPSTPKYTIED